MLGLFGTLDLGARSLQAQQLGMSVAGQNLANINNTAYARQRVVMQTSTSIPTAVGFEGTGVQVAAIEQLRDAVLDRQIQTETSVTGFWDTQQSTLQDAQAALGEQVDTTRDSSGATSADSGAGTVGGLLDSLNGLFQSFSTLATSPTSLANRQAVLSKAQQLAGQFNTVSQRLASIDNSLDESVANGVDQANQLLGDVAQLNQEISSAEATTPGSANDLRDLREQKLEDLAKVMNVDTSVGSDGLVNISTAGTLLVSGGKQVEQLATYPDANGHLLVEAASTAQPLALTGGSIQGAIGVRDGAMADLATGVNLVASTLITQLNAVHATGYNLNGTAGATFFDGTGAADIRVNASLVSDPSLLQAAGVAGAVGDNQVAQKMADLLNQSQAAFQGQTVVGGYSRIVSGLGGALATANSEITNQQTVTKMLQTQRDQVGGVSIDEEMTSMMEYQRAYQASARVVSAVDQMFDSLMNIQ